MAFIQPSSAATRSTPKLRLFCFPFAGGTATAFRSWESLPEGVLACPVELPGRGGRILEPPLRRMGPLIRRLAREMLPLLDRPFALFGHSTGALIAFELARALRLYGFQPAHLFVSAQPAPELPRTGPDCRYLRDAEFVGRMRRCGAAPPQVLRDVRLLEMLLPAFRADVALAETYTPGKRPPLTCPLTAFGGTDDPAAPHDSVAAWGQHTRGPFRVRMFPGGHFFILTSRAELVRSVGEEILRNALQRPAGTVRAS